MAAMFWVMMWHARRRLAAHRVPPGQREERAAARHPAPVPPGRIPSAPAPITIALGHSELLASDWPAQDRRDINVIVGELNRLRALSERLLLIAAAQNPEFLQPEPVALDELATEIIRRWRPAADRNWQLGRLDAVTVRADRERLSLAIDALLENAVQYTEAGGLVGLSGGGDSPFAGARSRTAAPASPAERRTFSTGSRRVPPGGQARDRARALLAARWPRATAARSGCGARPARAAASTSCSPR